MARRQCIDSKGYIVVTIYIFDGFELEKTRDAFDESGNNLGRYPLSTNIPATLVAQEGRVGGNAFRADTNLVIRATNTVILSGTYQTVFGFKVGTMSDTSEVSLCIVRKDGNIILRKLLMK